jgi:hypothetical protein
VSPRLVGAVDVPAGVLAQIGNVSRVLKAARGPAGPDRD